MDDILFNQIRKAYERYQTLFPHYNDINKYYYGNTDSLQDFTPLEGRSNLKIKTNFVQKLVDEEAAYSFGNSISYVTKDETDYMITKTIELALKNNDEDHDINLGIELIKNGIVYEINYLDDNNQFKNQIVSPLEGFLYREKGKAIFFMHIWEDDNYPEKYYLDIYTNSQIIHLDAGFNEIEPATTHYFGIIPVGYGIIGGKEFTKKRGYDEGDKTIYRTIKLIQDAFETNLSDSVCEISDLRNAILKIFGAKFENEDTSQPIIRNNILMDFDDKNTQDAEWLIKNINDTFIKNTRSDLKDLIYTLTSHLDTNEKLQSNLSGVALRSRLQMLEAKCRMNDKALTNIVKTRLICLFKYLSITLGIDYNVNLINIVYTPNVPVDITSNADVIAKVPHEVMSNKTKMAMMPMITDTESEMKQIQKEIEEENGGEDLDNLPDENMDNNLGDTNDIE